MLAENGAHLDIPTLSFAATCIAAMLGLFLMVAWWQQRSVRAFAWWGAAYLIGASSMALWSAPAQLVQVPPVVPAALIFIACGMIWNGVRLFQGRRLLPGAIFAGAILWAIACELQPFPLHSLARIALGMLVVAGYTFAIAFELGRERRKALRSRTATVVVPCLHAGIFLMPLAMRIYLPHLLAAGWLTVFTLESMIYAVGTAFIVVLTVKDHHVHVYRSAASTDPLTGLLNRRAFQEEALGLCARAARQREPVSVLVFDLDHFKSINDRFGHAVGDEALRVFAQAIRASMRANDILGRLGGEEFVAIVPADLDTAVRIAERARLAFQEAGRVIAGHAMGATVSVGTTMARAPLIDLDGLIARADAALYRAKNGGRNRVQAAEAGQSGADGYVLKNASAGSPPDQQRVEVN